MTGYAHKEITQVIHKFINNRLIVLYNSEWHRGIHTSRKCAIKYVQDHTGCDGLLFLPGDMPFVDGDVIDLVVSTFENNLSCVVYGTQRPGQKGHPVIFPEQVLSEFAEYEGGGKDFLKENSLPVIEVLLRDFTQLDIDRPGDLELAQTIARAKDETR